MTREELGNNISANIASVTMGCTNIEITSAIMKDVDQYAPRELWARKSTPAMRVRCRELAGFYVGDMDDFDRAVLCVLDDIEILLAGIRRAADSTTDPVVKRHLLEMAGI